MAERMGRNVLYDACLERPFGNRRRYEIPRKPDVFVGQLTLGSVLRLDESVSEIMTDEERFEIVLTGAQVFGNPLRRAFSQIHDADLSAFSADREFPGFEIYPAPVEVRQFRNTQTGRIDAFEYREVALVLNVVSRTSVEETFDFIDFQKRHVPVTAFR